jgi:hypothetical protein
LPRTKHELWQTWLDHTLFEDIRSPETLDPVPVFDTEAAERPFAAVFNEYRYGRGDGEYLYLLYFLDDPVEGPVDLVPMYIGETNTITSRLNQHATQIRDTPPVEEWADDGS